jgi:murein DD-endopeptidase MepM/ murein hydrolase activator NlpD
MARPLARARYAVLITAAGMAATLAAGSPAMAASAVTGTVSTGGSGLNVRGAANTSAAIVASIPNGGTVSLSCQVTGPSIQGTVRTTTMWDRTAAGTYVSDAYIQRGPIGACAAAPAPAATPAPALPAASSGWALPVPGTVGQQFRPVSNPSHQGVDIPEPRNTPIHAANAGTVVTVTCNTSGPSCDVDGGTSVTGCGWYVEIRHVNQVLTRYCHMVRQPSVTVDQKVTAGQVIGYVGTSGNSSGTHLHFEVHVGAGYPSSANAVDPVAFMTKMHAPLGVLAARR